MTDLCQSAPATLTGILQDTRSGTVCLVARPAGITLRVPWVSRPGPTPGTLLFDSALEPASFRDVKQRGEARQALARSPALAFYLGLFLGKRVRPAPGVGSLSCCLLLEGPCANSLLVNAVPADVPCVRMRFDLTER